MTRDAVTCCTDKVTNCLGRDRRTSIVIARLMGGMGNQLFQYAAARTVALKRQARLRLDTSWYHGRSDRRYVLSHFETQQDLLSPREARLLRYLTDDGKHARMKSAATSLLPLLRTTRVSDPPGAANPDIFPDAQRLLLDGFWQSPAYFSGTTELLRAEFQVKSAPDQKDATLIHQMGHCESVAVHVRRGDYVTDPAANRVHGTCGTAYYERAAELVRDRLGSPHFFVFSDDIDAARREIRLPGPTEFINGNAAQQDWNDLRLMASCRHHVIANSSFSWWGAWLAEHAEQLVVAPSAWYRPGAKPGHRIRDLIPEAWTLIEGQPDER